MEFRIGLCSVHKEKDIAIAIEEAGVGLRGNSEQQPDVVPVPETARRGLVTASDTESDERPGPAFGSDDINGHGLGGQVAARC